MTSNKDQIEKAIKASGNDRNRFNRVNNEGATDGYNPFEARIADMASQLIEIEKAESPLVSDLAGEKKWFNAQRYTGADLQKANADCLARGYSLADLQAAK